LSGLVGVCWERIGGLDFPNLTKREQLDFFSLKFVTFGFALDREYTGFLADLRFLVSPGEMITLQEEAVMLDL
jgi:hypothetical protein